MSVLLSICIPTYNRSRTLAETLSELISFKNTEIEIIVSDNSSPDETQEVVMSFKDSRIRYFRNEKNIGVVKNIIKSLEIANGKYLLLISDEDSVYLDNVLNAIYDNYDREPSLILGGVIGYDNHFLYKFKKRFFSVSFNTFRTLTWHSTAISGLIFLKKDIDFPFIISEVKKSSFGLSGFYPHNLIINTILLKGEVYTKDSTFIKIRADEPDQIEFLNDFPFVHYDNIFLTYKIKVDFINLKTKFSWIKKVQLIKKEYIQSLYTLLAYQRLYTDKPYQKYKTNLEDNYDEISPKLKTVMVGMKNYVVNLNALIFQKYLIIIVLNSSLIYARSYFYLSNILKKLGEFFNT
jgi:glycosyltransferase involved in cell wall biosynthesis